MGQVGCMFKGVLPFKLSALWVKGRNKWVCPKYDYQKLPIIIELWEIPFGQKCPLPLRLLSSRIFSFSPLTHLLCCSPVQGQHSTWSVPAQRHGWRVLHVEELPLHMLISTHFSGCVTAKLPGAPVNKWAVCQWPHSWWALIPCYDPELCNARIWMSQTEL